MAEGGETVSDTPRTDDAQFGTGRVSVDFARRLERELIFVTEQRDRLAEAAAAVAYRGESPFFNTGKLIRELEDVLIQVKGADQ